MKTSTFNKDGEIYEKDEWNAGLIFVIVFLYITVIGGFIVIVIGGAMFYLDMREDQRATDTWKLKRQYDQSRKATESCVTNAETLKALQEYNRQKGIQTPPDFLKVAECPAELPATIENNSQNH